MYKFPPLLPQFEVSQELQQIAFKSDKDKDIRTPLNSSPPPPGSRSTGSPGTGPELGPSCDGAQVLQAGTSTGRPLLQTRLSKVDLHSVAALNAEEESKSALLRCQDRLERLNQMNKMFESLADPAWSASENRHLLAGRLRTNKYFPALRAALERKRKAILSANRVQLEGADAPASDLGLSSRARSCSAEAESELRLFRALQQQTLSTLRAMLGAASAEVPLCHEEVSAAVCAAKRAYGPAFKAFEDAVDKSGVPPGEQHCGADSAAAVLAGAAMGGWEGKGKGSGKRGHLSEEAVSVLQDWLVRNFDDPYPSEEEKARLVEMTGITLRQINNWLSNARVRIWRPAVQGLN